MNKKNKAFSIVELVVVIAIIGILSTFALSAYNTQMTRSKIVEGIELLGYYAKQYQEYYQLYGYLPKSMPETLLATPNTPSVSQIYAGSNSSQGTGMFLYAVFQNSLGFGTNNRVVLVLIPDSSTRTIVHHCGQWQTTLYVPVKYLPSTCNETAMSTTYSSALVN